MCFSAPSIPAPPPPPPLPDPNDAAVKQRAKEAALAARRRKGTGQGTILTSLGATQPDPTLTRPSLLGTTGQG